MAPAQHQPVAIIDIGSNSVRLVIYSGATRTPSVIFNEKVMAGLGRGLDAQGALSAESQDRALAALHRFRILIDQMDVAHHRIVATAAVRDASNGAAFLDQVRALGFSPEMLSGEDEGTVAGLGVISSIPDANGIVGDLGGGSLELVDVARGQVRRSASLPLGVLRLAPLIQRGKGALSGMVSEALRRTGFAEAGAGRPFYMVGGSWRALGRLDLVLTAHPLPIIHQHRMEPGRPRELQAVIEGLDKAKAKGIPSLSIARVPTLPAANRLLRALVDALRPSRLIVSSFGIREGLLYQDLDPASRALDPLIEAARDAGTGLGRFAQHGDLLDRWIAPLFDGNGEEARLRLAACHLADIAWQAHPEFRAERGVDMALHGNWVGINAAGRVMLAQALHSNFGGSGELPNRAIASLCSPAELQRASLWGLAMRLGQRLSGGVAASLERSRLIAAGNTLRLELQGEDAALYGESVARRLKTLAGALGRTPEQVVV
jgi:exopolyphosphatase/guanosine-5'-triphosphate,3'-diphosphate pyrophosphatase